jgi:hypothetical protein
VQAEELVVGDLDVGLDQLRDRGAERLAERAGRRGAAEHRRRLGRDERAATAASVFDHLARPEERVDPRLDVDQPVGGDRGPRRPDDAEHPAAGGREPFQRLERAHA